MIFLKDTRKECLSLIRENLLAISIISKLNFNNLNKLELRIIFI